MSGYSPLFYNTTNVMDCMICLFLSYRKLWMLMCKHYFYIEDAIMLAVSVLHSLLSLIISKGVVFFACPILLFVHKMFAKHGGCSLVIGSSSIFYSFIDVENIASCFFMNCFVD